MPSTLQPGAPDITLIYYKVSEIAGGTREVKAKIRRGEVARVWVNILGERFPPRRFFVTHSKEQNKLRS
ncbi:uncharacterized protein ACHE_31248S [Aspergillus chevalieri]|uniref:Uncharacterized protein n=1 Tax=Aspergillus chevalieri TaxID=182096 RepID=A0A7R7ZN82_ASPCH|nr:uncharacterized protein ACHE_31248S [Aspergillus chevalieri]BCR87261.1 hypothetical protein ACHE_31248S [Aspergillus chevalieri]